MPPDNPRNVALALLAVFVLIVIATLTGGKKR